MFALANTQDFFCDEIIILQQLDNIDLQKSDFDLVSYVIIILGSTCMEKYFILAVISLLLLWI